MPDAGVPARVGRNHLGFAVCQRVLAAASHRDLAQATGKHVLTQRQACHRFSRTVIIVPCSS